MVLFNYQKEIYKFLLNIDMKVAAVSSGVSEP